MIPVNLKILNERIEDVGLPKYATPGSAAVDLIACIDEPLVLKPGDTHLIPTGISIHVGNPDYAAFVLPRSGLGHKSGLCLGNGTGLIDADYTGELFVSAFNRNSRCVIEAGTDGELSVKPNLANDITISPGDRIAQLMFLPVEHANFMVVDAHTKSERGEGGFGHSGIN